MKIKILDLKHLDESFQVSRLEVLGDQFYFISPDGNEILFTDNKWKTPQRFPVKNIVESGLAKAPATVLVRDGKNPAILVLGVAGGNKLSALKINLKSRSAEAVDLGIFHDRLIEAGITGPDIRSATIINDKIVLSIAGTETEPNGTFIVTDSDFWKKQDTADFAVSRLQWEKLTERPVEISSIFYSYHNDLLLIAGNSTVVEGSNESGLEHETLMGVVENAYRKIDRKRIKVNELFSLGKENENLLNRTITAMSAEDGKGKKVKIHLIGKNRAGENSLIKIRLKAD